MSIAVGSKVRIEKGCKDLEITKGSTAKVVSITELGPDYSHSVRVELLFLNSFLSTKTLCLYARHINRLSDPFVNLHGCRTEHKIVVVKVA